MGISSLELNHQSLLLVKNVLFKTSKSIIQKKPQFYDHNRHSK